MSVEARSQSRVWRVEVVFVRSSNVNFLERCERTSRYLLCTQSLRKQQPIVFTGTANALHLTLLKKTSEWSKDLRRIVAQNTGLATRANRRKLQAGLSLPISEEEDYERMTLDDCEATFAAINSAVSEDALRARYLKLLQVYLSRI